MIDDLPQLTGGAHLRTVALPRDANASGDIFGGWTLSQMDLAGRHLRGRAFGKRVVTVRIEAVEYRYATNLMDRIRRLSRIAEGFSIA